MAGYASFAKLPVWIYAWPALCALLMIMAFRRQAHRHRALVQRLGGRSFVNAIWFEFNGATHILSMTAAHATRTPGGRGGPLFDLYIPIAGDRYWFIQMASKSRLIAKVTGWVDALSPQESHMEGGEEFRYWSDRPELRAALTGLMPKIAPLFLSAEGPPLWLEVSAERRPLFYRWRPRFGWYLRIAGLPEGLDQRPDDIFAVLTNAKKLIQEMGMRVR